MQEIIEHTQRIIAPYVWPFYRIYKYEGKISIVRADARGVISEMDEFFYNRIPKVANSTIVNSLVYWSSFRIENNLYVNSKLYFRRPASVGVRTALDIKRKYFKFMFVRNPFTRVLSAYLDKVVREDSRRHSRHYHKWSMKTGASRASSFADFCSYLDDGGLYEDAHWAPQLDCLLIPVSEFDFVGRFERLETDLQTVLKRLFPDRPVEIRCSGPSKTHAGDKLHSYYSDREIDIVSRLYAGDFQTFGYNTDIDDFHVSPIGEPLQSELRHL